MRAVRLSGAAKHFLESIGAWQQNVEVFESDFAPSRAALSESEFAQAMEEGHAMTMEQAVAYALDQER